MSRAAAASRSPREREVRAGPGGGSAGRGRRRRALHSHGELSAAAAGRHTPARRARLSVGAAVCTGFLRRAGPSPCAPLCSKLLWRPERNCRRRALCGGGRGGGVLTLVSPGGWKQSGASLLCLGQATPRKARRSPVDCGTRRCAEKSGDLDPQARLCRSPGTAQSRSRALRRGEEERVLLRKRLQEKFGSSRLPAGPQRSPTAEAERDGTPGRWLSRGFLLLACLGRVWVPRSE